MKSWWAKGGYFAPALASMFVPGANTVTGAATTGAVLGAVQPTTEDESHTQNAMVGGLFGMAGQAAGQVVGGAVRNTIAARAAARAEAEAANKGRDAALSTGREAGYSAPPTQVKPTLINRALEGAAGKLTTAQRLSADNQAVTNRLIAKELGLPEGEALTKEAFAGVRKKAGQAYENLANGTYETDKIYKDRLAALTKRHSDLAAEVPELADKEILALAKSLDKGQFAGRTAIDAIGALREKASKAFNAGDKALGKTYRGMADEMENLIERNLLALDTARFNISKVSGGAYQAPKDALAAFREARQQIAKSYGAEGALEGSNINAAKYAQYLKKGKPLTGESKTVAQFASEFPKVVQLPQKIGSQPGISPLDVAVAAGLGDMKGLAWMPTRIGARALVASKRYQRAMVTPEYKPGLVELGADVATGNNRLATAARLAALQQATDSR
jgi:hypothetical protein